MRAAASVLALTLAACTSAEMMVPIDVRVDLDQRFDAELAARADRPAVGSSSTAPANAADAYLRAIDLADDDETDDALLSHIVDGAASARIAWPRDFQVRGLFRLSRTTRHAVIAARARFDRGDQVGAVTGLIATAAMGLDCARGGQMMESIIGEAIADNAIHELTALAHDDAVTLDARRALLDGLANLLDADYDPRRSMALELRFVPWMLAHAPSGTVSIADARGFLGPTTRKAVGRGDFRGMVTAFDVLANDVDTVRPHESPTEAALRATRALEAGLGPRSRVIATDLVVQWSARRDATHRLFVATSRAPLTGSAVPASGPAAAGLRGAPR